MFIGEYNFNLDNSHRLNVPTSFKKYLEESLVIAKGFEKCLYLYNLTDWIELQNKINNLSFTKSNNRKFARGLNSGAYEAEVDAKGRICISNTLLVHAGITKECVIIGVGNRIEIWDKSEYDKYLNENQDIMESIGEELDI